VSEAAAGRSARRPREGAADGAVPAKQQAIVRALAGDDPTPRYLRLAGALARLIETEVFLPGDAVPSERDLAQLTGYARVTVRNAIDELIRSGTLSRRHGSGTFVASRIEQPLSVLASFSADIESRGGRPGSIWLSRELARPKPQESMALGLGATDSVIRLTRVRTADGEPLAIECAVVPAAILPSPDLIDTSLYAALATQGAVPAHGVQRIHAGLATLEEARHLGIPPGSALLRIERRAFLGNGKPVEFTVSAYRGDRYDFVATLRGEAMGPQP
jgi:GntR family transcriptional regulator